MRTPICDFVRRYADSRCIRMHMPGHKGTPLLGCEPLDITEIAGADEMLAPSGIIAESEQNASALFGCRTLYSAEGSSLCIRAMLYLAMQYAAQRGRKPVILAARNVHKAFLTAAVLLDFTVIWLPQQNGESCLQCTVTPDAVAKICENTKDSPIALYVTSPDYLGNLTDIPALAEYCHAHDMLLLCDNAHGAYLRFLPQSLHPADRGADICCDSAHKTLPVLTGGAYLHLADSAPEICHARARQALSLFASTSPSYLILQSLDRCNALLEEEFPMRLRKTAAAVEQCKARLRQNGYCLCGKEPMKLTVAAKAYGYTGTDLADMLMRRGIVFEFADRDFLVLMPSPYHSAADIRLTADVLCSVPQKDAITEQPPHIPQPETVCTPREAMLGTAVTLPLNECIGRICAEIAVSCPPAVPVAVCGERITKAVVACLAYYGAETCAVLDNPAIR